VEIVRKNSGRVFGVGGASTGPAEEEVATDVSIMTGTGVARIIRFAFKLAQSRPQTLTVVTKSSAHAVPW
jgi:tartrate dehydrogenase/decarboxylase/D-malate dehydrogenase